MGDKEENDPSKLRLASERSDAQITLERKRQGAERAAQALSSATRGLAANILRIIAGGGKTYSLVSEVIAVLKAFEELQPYVGSNAYPYSAGSAMGEALIDLDWRKNNPAFPEYNSLEFRQRWREAGAEEVKLAREAIITAALRVTAAQLVRQSTQERTSENQLIGAIIEFEEARIKRSRLLTPARPPRKRK